MKTTMGFRHKFAYSFFDFSAYKEFLIQGLGKSVLYIFLVTLIFATITNFKTISSINSELDTIENNLIHNSPDFELKNGVLSVNSNQTIYYKHDGDFLFNFLLLGSAYLSTDTLLDSNKSNVKDNFVNRKLTVNSDDSKVSTNTDKPNYYTIIIDTNKKTSPSVLDSYKDGVYIDADKLIIRKDYKTLNTVDFSQYPMLNATKDIVLAQIETIKNIVPIVLLIFGPIASFISNLILGFIIFGPFCLLFGSFVGVKFNYSKACTLSFYAMTLPLLLQSLLDVAGIEINEFFIIFYAITLLYCILAIRDIKNTDKSNVNLLQ